MERKIHSNSVLKNLPVEKQAEIIAHIDGPGGSSLVETAKWLEGDGISVTTGMLSVYRRWYLMRQKMASSGQLSLETAAEWKKRGWIKTAQQERAAAQSVFNRLVLEEGDPKLWAMVERVNLLKDKVDLDKRKLKLVTQKFKDKPTNSNRTDGVGMSAEEKEAAIRQIYGMS